MSKHLPSDRPRRWLPPATCAVAGLVAFLAATNVTDTTHLSTAALATYAATTGAIGGVLAAAWLQRPRPPRRPRASERATR